MKKLLLFMFVLLSFTASNLFAECQIQSDGVYGYWDKPRFDTDYCWDFDAIALDVAPNPEKLEGKKYQTQRKYRGKGGLYVAVAVYGNLMGADPELKAEGKYINATIERRVNLSMPFTDLIYGEGFLFHIDGMYNTEDDPINVLQVKHYNDTKAFLILR